ILHLEPGHWLSLSTESGALRTERWWWPDARLSSTMPFQKAAEQFREIFLENIRLHLRSDVPVGAALSGGLDSSAVVCGMRHLEPSMAIHTFSYVAKGTEYDE